MRLKIRGQVLNSDMYLRKKIVQYSDGVALAEQILGEVGTDETSATSYKGVHWQSCRMISKFMMRQSVSVHLAYRSIQ